MDSKKRTTELLIIACALASIAFSVWFTHRRPVLREEYRVDTSHVHSDVRSLYEVTNKVRLDAVDAAYLAERSGPGFELRIREAAMVNIKFALDYCEMLNPDREMLEAAVVAACSDPDLKHIARLEEP